LDSSLWLSGHLHGKYFQCVPNRDVQILGRGVKIIECLDDILPRKGTRVILFLVPSVGSWLVSEDKEMLFVAD
jgi:hypothetical protein